MYNINFSYSDDFVDFFNNLKLKYPEKLFDIQGISDDKLDLVKFSKDFFSKSSNVADLSVDDNANVSEKNISQYNVENNKSLMKLNSYYLLYKYVKKFFGTKSAEQAVEKMLNGDIFINDFANFNQSYCFAFDLRELLYNGMSFFKGNMKIKPPKRAQSFISLLIQSTAFISNQIAGACLHKNQEIVYKENTLFYSKKIKDFISNFNLNKSFTNHQGDWEYIEVSGYEVWENERTVPIKRIYRRKYNEDIYEITTASGKKVRVSKDHVFKVVYKERDIEVKAKDLRLYDTLYRTEKKGYFINKDSDEYKEGQIIGILAGDGCLTKINMITVSNNIKDGERIKDIFDSYIQKKFNKTGNLINRKKNGVETWSSYEIYSKEIQEYFQSFFVDGLYCSNKYIDIEKYSLEFLAGFVDGMLVTDGGFYQNHSISLTSEKLLNNIVDILDKLNIQHSDTVQYNDKRGNRKTLYTITIKGKINNYLQLTNIKRRSLSEKYCNLKTIEVAYIGRCYNEKSIRNKSRIYTQGYTSTGDYTRKVREENPNTDVIINIETFKNDDDYVYEIETESHWYSINGILTHNCSYPDAMVILNAFLQKDYGNDYLEKEEFRKDIENLFQNLIYSFNFPFRQNQSSFTNLSVMDRGFMENLFKDYILPDGLEVNYDNTISLSKWFFEYYSKINQEEGIFTFPVVTLAISLDEKGQYIDPDFVKWAAVANSEKCLANIFQSTPTSFSSCCRLINNYDLGYQNSFGVAGLSVGSSRVAGLNLARLGAIKDDGTKLRENLEVVHKVLFSHRELIKERISNGVMPLYDSNWIHLSRQYCTVGFVGSYEYLANKGVDILSEEGIEDLKSVLLTIEEYTKKWTIEDKITYNIEQIPAESMAVRLAKIDNLFGYNNSYELYSNQYIPLIHDASIYDRLHIQGIFDSYTSGGAIAHINIDDEKSLTPTQLYRLMDHARRLKTVYFAINYAFIECENGHITIGKKNKCPICDGEIVNMYTRVVGFLTPVKSWNKTRREYEFKNRHFYSNEESEI